MYVSILPLRQLDGKPALGLVVAKSRTARAAWRTFKSYEPHDVAQLVVELKKDVPRLHKLVHLADYKGLEVEDPAKKQDEPKK